MSAQSVAILGPGLIGGSLALALTARSSGATISLWARRTEAVETIKATGLEAAVSTDLKSVLADADIVVLATPIGTMAELASQLVKVSDPSKPLLITDVGSVKDSVVTSVSSALEGSPHRFVGSHPMAGSEQAGFEAARSDLFQGAPCIVTPTPDSEADDVARIEKFWTDLGCRTQRMAPDAHDQCIGRVSHLPHVVAAVLADAALSCDTPTHANASGSGLRDSTRIAAGDADLWLGILSENREATIHAMEDFQDRFSQVLAFFKDMDDDSLRCYLEHARKLRNTLS